LGIEKKFNWKRLFNDSKIALEDYKSIIQKEEDKKNISIFKIRDHIEDYIKLDLKKIELTTHICFKNNVF
jgi:hypothetical protein